MALPGCQSVISDCGLLDIVLRKKAKASFLCEILGGGYRVTQDQWYSNKQLFEMMQSLTTKMAELQLEMAQTTILIRDYNGLRQKIMDCEKALEGTHGKEIGGQNMYGYIFGVLCLIISAAAVIVKGVM